MKLIQYNPRPSDLPDDVWACPICQWRGVEPGLTYNTPMFSNPFRAKNSPYCPECGLLFRLADFPPAVMRELEEV